MIDKQQEIMVKSRKEIDFTKVKKDIITTLEKNKNISLATAYNNRVTNRNVQYINDGLDIYFTSWGFNKKIQQIEKNPNVGLNQMEIQIEGKAEIHSWPLDEKLQKIEKKFSEKYKWFTKLQGKKDAVFVKIIPSKIVLFKSIDGLFYLQNVDLQNKKVFQMRLRDKQHPNYPF